MSTEMKEKKNLSAVNGFLIAIASSTITIIAILVILVVFIVKISKSSNILETEVVKEGDVNTQIAIIPIEGVISDGNGSSAFNPIGADAKTVLSNLETARNDKSIKAIVLYINSPGGEIVASDDIYHEILKVKKSKPVYAYISSMGASGAYYVAVGSNYITAHRSAMIGSIGVIMDTVDMHGLYDKLGVKVYTFKSGDFKDNSALRDPEKAEELKAIYQNLIDTNLDTFIEVVANGRNMSEDDVRKLADGRVYTAKQAIDNGLIDNIGYLDDLNNKIIRDLKLTNPRIIKYKKSDGFLSGLSGVSDVVSSINPLVKNKEHGLYLYYLLEL